MNGLFAGESQIINLPDAKLQYFPVFYPAVQAEQLFDEICAACQWQQPDLRLYGREVKTPRLVAWAGDPGLRYRYSGLEHRMTGWPEILQQLKDDVISKTGYEFNSVLLNLYRDGNDSMSWHSDDEPELGETPVVASLSFGQPRRFLLRHRNGKHNYELPLGNGDLLVMAGACQQHWQHSIPKTRKTQAPRLNLSFRLIQ